LVLPTVVSLKGKWEKWVWPIDGASHRMQRGLAPTMVCKSADFTCYFMVWFFLPPKMEHAFHVLSYLYIGIAPVTLLLVYIQNVDSYELGHLSPSSRPCPGLSNQVKPEDQFGSLNTSDVQKTLAGKHLGPQVTPSSSCFCVENKTMDVLKLTYEKPDVRMIDT